MFDDSRQFGCIEFSEEFPSSRGAAGSGTSGGGSTSSRPR